MKLTDNAEIREYFQMSLYEMSNYSPEDTGLPSGTNLWVRTEPKVLPHVKYRVKIEHPQKGKAIFAIWGDDAEQIDGPKGGDWRVSGKELKKIKFLIRLTHEQIRSHIDGTLSSGQLGKVFDAVRTQIEEL